MAVVVWRQSEGFGEFHGPKNFHPPKRSDLRNWYKEVRKVLPRLPMWEDRFAGCAVVDVNTIFWELPQNGVLIISRKRHMR